MNKYKFATEEIGISETGIHLLRSNFNYKTIEYKEISLLEIEHGKLINNWIFILIIGIGLVVFSIYYTVGLYNTFNDPTIHQIDVNEIVIPVLPILFGGFCIYSSSKSGIVIKIENKGKKSSFPLTDLMKKNELNDFIAYLKSNRTVNSKLKIYIKE